MASSAVSLAPASTPMSTPWRASATSICAAARGTAGSSSQADFVDRVSKPDQRFAGLPSIDQDKYPRASSHYGLLWWNNADGTLPKVPRDAFWSWGLHDSLIVVIPSLDIVVSRAGKGWIDGWAGDYSRLAPFLNPIVAAVANPPSPLSLPAQRRHHRHRVGPDQVDHPQSRRQRQLAAHLGRRRSSVHGLRRWLGIRTQGREEAEPWVRSHRGSPRQLPRRQPAFAVRREDRTRRSGTQSQRHPHGRRCSLHVDAQRGERCPDVVGRSRQDLARGRLAIQDKFRRAHVPQLRRELFRRPRRLRLHLFARQRQRLQSRRPAGHGPRPARVHPQQIRLRVLRRTRPRRQPALEPIPAAIALAFSRTRDASIAPPSPTTPASSATCSARSSYGGDTRFAGGFGVYDAPEPWGPWTTVYHTNYWDVGPGETCSFPTKWMSPDGTTLHMVFSGEDAFSVRKAKLTTRDQ